MRFSLITALCVLSLGACNRAPPNGAAEAATRLLAAAQADDRVAFEAEIDRSAVRDDVRRQVIEMARATSLDVDGGPSEFALDRMISPDAVRLVDAAGHALTSSPTAGQVAPLLKVVGGKRVCLRDRDPGRDCVLTFARERARWRLVAMKATDLRIELAAAGD